MSSPEVVINVAGMVVRFRSVCRLRFLPVEFRGFAVPGAQVVDMDIDVEVAPTSGHDESACVSSFVGDCRGTEMPDHRWETGFLADGSEYIVVDFYDNSLYNWVKLTLGQSKGLLQLSLKDSSVAEVDPYIFPLLNIMVSRLIRRRHGFLVHSSVVSDNGNGYLFTAVSGTGKSTMAGLWESMGASVINDDMLALVPCADGVVANNIPMPYYSSTPRRATLKGIFLISQSKVNFINPMNGALAALRFLSNTISQPCTKAAAVQHLEDVSSVTARVPVFSLGFKPDVDIVRDIRNLNL